MRLPPGLSFYRAASQAAGAIAPGWLKARAGRGKEDPARLGERFGQASAPRPDGVLIWLHAASVGETKVALQVMAAIASARPELHVLLTTGTITAARIVEAAAPARAVHQYAPLDRPDCAARFLAHWRPDLAVFAESELWPNMILAAHAMGAKLALVNARMSPKSLANWARLKDSAALLLQSFSLILAADQRTADGLAALRGRAVTCVGNLKLAAIAAPVDAARLAALKTAIGNRPVWLAASTHAGEDNIVLAAHARICAAFPDALVIIAPRHPDRGEAIAALANGAPRRALAALPLPQHRVYVADTIGEMALLTSLAPTTLVAGSLRADLKGHNPIEPIQTGSAVISGPHIESFADLFAALRESDGVVFVDDAQSLAEAILHFWRHETERAAMHARAAHVIAAGAPALSITRDQLLSLLPGANDETA
jgi:3-deoxy-D-manno-octulosonic-acid transferase